MYTYLKNFTLHMETKYYQFIARITVYLKKNLAYCELLKKYLNFINYKHNRL